MAIDKIFDNYGIYWNFMEFIGIEWHHPLVIFHVANWEITIFIAR